MRVNEKKNQRGRDAFAIGVLENEGGALAQLSIYHVFTGVPAVFDGRAIPGLGERKPLPPCSSQFAQRP